MMDWARKKDGEDGLGKIEGFTEGRKVTYPLSSLVSKERKRMVNGKIRKSPLNTCLSSKSFQFGWIKKVR